MLKNPQENNVEANGIQVENLGDKYEKINLRDLNTNNVK